jgi:phosphate transport system permease protein
MGVMIIPFVSSLADDMITAVPQSTARWRLRAGRDALRNHQAVVLPRRAAGHRRRGPAGVSRAIGETMIVVMAAGLGANLTANPLEAVTTVTVQIVTLLVGDQEFDSPKTLAAFALGPGAVPGDPDAQHHRAVRGPQVPGAVRMRANDGDDDRARRQLSPEETRRRVDASLRRRYRSEQLFRFYGLCSVCLGVVFLLILFGTIIGNGYSAFRQGFLHLDIHFDADLIDPDGGRDLDVLSAADYSLLVKAALRKLVPEAASRSEKRELNGLVSSGAVFELRDTVMADAQILGQTRSLWLPLNGDVDLWIKARLAGKSGEDMGGKLSANQRTWLERLQADDRIELRFNRTFFTSGDSREPELAGIWGATKGSFFMLLVTLLLSFPLGVAAAIYLEEFARRSWWVDIVEVNINNLAAVPSIVFGLLGLAVFINFFGLPRSAPLVGGLVLTLMTLPVVIIASRAAIKAVPPSVREAALGIGASQDADGVPSCAAAGDAGHADGRHHRHGPGAR